MTDPIDYYSRPVGWWCDVCGWESLSSIKNKCHCTSPVARLFWVPVYLPLPTPEPVEVDEVETGEAEVCTGSLRDDAPCCWVAVDAVFAPDNGWLASIVHLAEYADADHINDIAAASANARKTKKRGMK